MLSYLGRSLTRAVEKTVCVQNRLPKNPFATPRLQQRNMASQVNLSEEEWKVKLTPAQFKVLREKGTEKPGTGEYNKFFKDGTYLCAGCEAPLYKSETKFDSGCGWPAFYQAIDGALTLHVDKTFGMTRTEIVCSACGGHIGHVFYDEGYKNPTNERHCANSISLKFKPKK